MFHFRRKDKEREEKDKKKVKDKKEKKESKRPKDKPLTQDELNRLDEVKSSHLGVRHTKSDTKYGSENSNISPTKERPVSLKITSDSSESSLSSYSGKSPDNGELKSNIPVINRTSNKGFSPTKSNSRPPLPTSKPPISKSSSGSKIIGSRTLSSSKLNSNDFSKSSKSATLSSTPDEVDNVVKTDKNIYDVHSQGIGLGINSVELNELNLPLPVLQPSNPPPPRKLIIPRLPAGDFGFSLRRAAILDKHQLSDLDQNKRTIIFAEPGSLGRTNNTGLFPGDRLLEVNDILVENKSRDEIITLIKSSGDSVKLCVQLIPELIELTLRSSAVDGHQVKLDDSQIRGGTLSRSASKRFKKMTKSDDQIVRERAWLDEDRVWVVHKDGFTLARKNKHNFLAGTDGKIKVELDSKDVITVNEEDVETANPPHSDKLEGLSQLRHLNESSVLHVLRQRYGSNLIHTYAGNTMLIINPVNPLPIYSDKVMQLFKGCRQEDMPPHIYAIAQAAYQKLLKSRRDQSIVFCGRSGSGKSTNFRHTLQYLTQISGSVSKILTAEKVNAAATLLEAFGNSRTAMNSNASKFTQLFSVDYDQSGQITSASVQGFLLERNRVARRPVKEPTFHVLYQMIAGVHDSLRKDLYLDNLSDFNIFMSPLQRIEDKQKATLAWACIRNSMDVLGITSEEVRAITSVLAAIYHLGSAGANVSSGSSGAQFSKPQNAQKAASLLGLPVEELSRVVFQSNSSSNGRTYRSPSPVEKSMDAAVEDAVEALEAMVAGLYFEVFNALISLINRCLSSGNRSVSSILLLDSPGVQNPATCGRTSGASFQELCQNYAQDRLQLLYHENTLIAPLDKYSQENIDCDFGDMSSFIQNPLTLVNILDKQSQQGLLNLTRSSSTDLRDSGISDGKGIFCILDEESIYPGSSDESFMDRVKTMLSSDKEKSAWAKVDGKQLIINHMQGTNPVKYNTSGWLHVCRENSLSKSAPSLLQDSDHELISKLFVYARGTGSNSFGNLNLGSLEAGSSASLRRMSSIRRCAGTGGLKRRSVPLQVKFQMDAIVETLRKTNLHFVQCILPQHKSAVSDARLSLNSSPLFSNRVNDSTEECHNVHVPLLRSQVRGFQVMSALRMHKQGYSDHVLFQEFLRKFAILVPTDERSPKSPDEIPDERKNIEDMIDRLDIEQSSYRLGVSKIFFRSGIITQLEDRRDDKLKDLIVRFQGFCRGYLGRKNFKEVKVQDVAIRCIQKNVRKFNVVKSWPWWRLYVKLLPVLNVHRTEEDLKSKVEQMELLKSKLEKCEKERNNFKHDRDKLEAKMSELTADLVEEHATTVQAAEVLDAQSGERMRLEKEVQDLQEKLSKSQKNTKELEMEVIQARMFQLTEMNGDVSDDDSGMMSIYKEKYERSAREFEFKMKRLKQHHEEEIEQEQMQKKVLDKKLSQAIADTEEEHHHTMQWKKKCQKLNSEMQDLKIMLETESSRNLMLEKKQRKFDSELNNIQEELKLEKGLREKISREKEVIQAEKYSLEQELQSVKVDSEFKAEKLIQLNRELDELAFGHKGDDELFQLKKTKHEMERKLQDQEEELDDLAGQVQMLEQAKLRLEMNLEKTKQEYRKELNAREEEAEEARAVASKKVKAIEMQLEAEHDERQKLSREKHELERRLVDLQDQPPEVDPEIERRLRRDLKRTKALLRDSQLMLDHNTENIASKSAIRQLKNQLEDAEFAKMAAIKSKQGVEMELEDIKIQLEEISKTKAESVRKVSSLSRDKAELQSQLEESEEEVAEIMKKYKATVFQLSCDQTTLNEQSCMISDLEAEKQSLKTLLSELTSKVEMLEGETTDIHTVKRLEMKIKELESKLELESTHKARIENQLSRLKEQCEKLEQQSIICKNREQEALDLNKKMTRQMRDLREDLTDSQQKESDGLRKINQLEMALDNSEMELNTAKSDLKLAFRRIEDLQAAMEGEMGSDYSDYSASNTDTEDTDDENFEAFLTRRSSSAQVRKASLSSSEGVLNSMKNSSSAEFHSLSPGGSRTELSDEDETQTPKDGAQHVEEFV